jgi:hypothetical protein
MVCVYSTFVRYICTNQFYCTYTDQMFSLHPVFLRSGKHRSVYFQKPSCFKIAKILFLLNTVHYFCPSHCSAKTLGTLFK